MHNMNEKADQLIEDFDFLENWEEKYQYIIDLGKSLPTLADSDKNDVNRIYGCMSQVWLCVAVGDDGVDVQADSDAIIVRGLIALIRNLVQGQPAEEVASFQFLAFFEKLGLDRQLSPNRRNGMVAFVARLQDLVR